ncbi:cytochrome P450 3A16-like isoform X2 [Hydractinia symbiolongicarpus]|uniref:cytochrome P450 3A16-like isoform X2 n=1 Tax=Hydractinia symbiolongicarpus TaxID=13093 RepID=UPI00255067FC|nr:cytochrome P450 3A16-like isoform X2 [Hydractinia symbiolongicarpus]
MIFILILSLLISYYLYTWIKFYFSPLYRIPQVPELPFLGHNLYFLGSNVDTLNLLENWIERFKDEGVFKFRTFAGMKEYTIVVTNPSDMKYILSRPDSFKRNDFFPQFLPLVGDGLLVATGEHHRFQKRVILKALSQSSMKSYLPVFNKHTDVLVKLWMNIVKDKPNGTNLAVKEYFNNLSFDIFGEIGFGYEFNSQTTEINALVKTFKDAAEGVLNLKIIQRRRDKINCNSLTEQEKHDLLSRMMTEKDDKTGVGFSEKILRDNAYTLLIAGHETTATSLPGFLLYFAKYPDYQEKARKEIHDNLNGKLNLTVDDLNLIPFTTAFIMETLRMFTALPMNARLSKVDYKIGKYEIPKGCNILFPTWALNKDKESFDDSCEFKPERYFEGSKLKNGTSFTFGYGPYNCVGKNFAIQEIKIVLIKLMQNFKFSIDEENLKTFRKVFLTLKYFPSIKIRVMPLS